MNKLSKPIAIVCLILVALLAVWLLWKPGDNLPQQTKAEKESEETLIKKLTTVPTTTPPILKKEQETIKKLTAPPATAPVISEEEQELIRKLTAPRNP